MDATFNDRFTVFPDSGITELHCNKCVADTRLVTRWKVGYHPSLDVLIEQARAHNLAEHGEHDR
jgi:predicted transposase YbfD/YdcC